MRTFLFVVLLLVVGLVGGLWWLLSDANRFKPELVELIEANTGLHVEIAGNLSWRLWPPVQLVAEDVSADWTADAATPLLQTKSLRLDADLWPLLGSDPKLIIQGIVVDGLRARLVQTGDQANWMPPGSNGAVVPPIPIPAPVEDPSGSPWEVASIGINDAVIDYVVDGAASRIDIDALSTRNIAPGQRFPLHAKLLVENAQSRIPLTVSAQFMFNAAVTQWQIDDIEIDGELEDRNLPFRLSGNAKLDTGAGSAALEKANLALGDITAAFEVTATDLLGEPRYAGRIDMPRQRLDKLAALLDSQIDEPVGFATAFTARADRVDLTGLSVNYGDALFTGKFGARLAGRPAFDFDLKTDQFTIPSDEPSVATLGAGSFAALAFAAPGATVNVDLDEPLLPLELIRSTDWNGTLTVKQLHYEGAVFNNARITSTNTAGKLATTVELPDFFGGSAVTQLNVDARTNTPQWRIAPTLANVDSKALLAWTDKPYDWVALFLAGGEMSMAGNTQRELTQSLTGHASFDGKQGLLDISEIKRQALAVAQLAGGTELIKAWPDRLQYQRFTGTWDTKGTTQDLDIALDNLTLKANGTLDALSDAMDMAITITVNDIPAYNSFKVSSLLMNLPLPVRCRGSLEAPKCGADEAGTRKLLAQALSGKNPEMKAKLDQAIDEKVPEEYRDTARSLLDLLNKGSQKPAPAETP